jgi:hypothetical protein
MRRFFQASENEVIFVMRVSIVCVGLLATLMALTIKSIYGLWYLCADLVYVILFPQLLCVVYMEKSNTYGCLCGYAVGLFLRLSGGEPLIFFPPLIHFPMYTEVLNDDGTITGTQYFPFRTMSMVCSLSTVVGVSLLTEWLFKAGKVPIEWDFLTCVVNIPPERITLPHDASFMTSTDTLAMHKIRSDNGMVNPLLLTANDSGMSGGSTPATETSALAPNDFGGNRDYNSLERP